MKKQQHDGELPVGISYSMGASSEQLIELVIQGVVPRPKNIAVFCADTKDEHEWSYEAREQVEERCRRAGIPFFSVSRAEGLSEQLLTNKARKRIELPPLHVEGAGKLQTRCSPHFKTELVRRRQAEWLKSLGLPKKIVTWIGFAADEQHRATKAIMRGQMGKGGKRPRAPKWVKLDFPAIRLGMNRAAQRAFLVKHTGRAPRFSACIECPFKDYARWKQTSESDLKKAYAVDEAIRDLSHLGITDGDCYLTDRLIPIETLIRKGDPQPNLPGLESYCDGGACFL